MLETLAHALDRLADTGSTDGPFVDDGERRAVPPGRRFRPAGLLVAAVVRFESACDPHDEAIIVPLADVGAVGDGVGAHRAAVDADAHLTRRSPTPPG